MLHWLYRLWGCFFKAPSHHTTPEICDDETEEYSVTISDNHANKSFPAPTHQTGKAHYLLFGVELEGGKWPRHSRNYMDVDITVHTGCIDDGECKTPYGLPLKEAQSFIKKCYPRRVNETCGMHVHVSFGAENIAWALTLAEGDFFNFFLSEAEHFGQTLTGLDKKRFFSRLEGKNRACSRVSNLKQKLFIGGGDKNVLLNYCAKYQTVEFRLAPMFLKAKTAKRYLLWLSGILENYCLKHGKPTEEQIEKTIFFDWSKPIDCE